MTDKFIYDDVYNDSCAVSQSIAYWYLPLVLDSGNGIPSYFNFNHSNIVPKDLNSRTTIGMLGDINMQNTDEYVKLTKMEKPLSVRRKKLWSYKTSYNNTYRGKSYYGSLEMYIYEPHLIDLEQTWYQPTVTVKFYGGKTFTLEFTWDQFEDTPFYGMIDNIEDAHRTYQQVSNDITTLSTVYRSDIE